MCGEMSHVGVAATYKIAPCKLLFSKRCLLVDEEERQCRAPRFHQLVRVRRARHRLPQRHGGCNRLPQLMHGVGYFFVRGALLECRCRLTLTSRCWRKAFVTSQRRNLLVHPLCLRASHDP